ncbi:hypothetical protein N9Z12_02270 [Opitutaceae bacterium]|nr:hypothetical protein [bacterium]MDB4384856.1 hypothetical protein [Opitutaceae bacterium]
MRNLTLILSVIALIGAVASGVMFFIIGNSKQELFHRWQNTDAKLTATEAKLIGAQRENEELQNQVRVLDADLATHKRDLTALRLEAEQMQQSLELLEEARASAVEARESALVDLGQATDNLAILRRQLAESVSPVEVQQYQQTIADLEARIEPLERRLAQKNAAPALVSGRSNHAQVVKVGPRNAFVVINFGSTHGAITNQRFALKRGNTALATAEISLTKEHYSIAQVLPESLSGNIRKGDAATIIP